LPRATTAESFALKLWRHGARSNELVQTHQWCVAANPPQQVQLPLDRRKRHSAFAQAAELTFKLERISIRPIIPSSPKLNVMRGPAARASRRNGEPIV